MKALCIAAIISLTSPLVQAEIDGVYGQDNRKDIYEVSSALHTKLAKSSAAMIPAQMFAKSSKASFFNLEGAETLERAENVCTSEKFSQQPTAAMCSGFLVGEDLLITAGHCFNGFASPEQVCKSVAWVFDFQMDSASSTPTQNIPISNIYLCKKVVATTLSQKDDYTIIKLDRKVVGREPLKFRTTGKIADTEKLVVIGNPTGLPTKISDGGKVLSNKDPHTFVTNLDTFHGNSGSAVFDASTGMVEGILIQGKTDYSPSIPSNSNSCQVVNQCDEDGKNCSSKEPIGFPELSGEVVYRITNISTKIQQALAQ